MRFNEIILIAHIDHKNHVYHLITTTLTEKQFLKHNTHKILRYNKLTAASGRTSQFNTITLQVN